MGGCARSDARLDDLLRDHLEPCTVRRIVAVVDREVKVVCAVYLDIEETGTAAR